MRTCCVACVNLEKVRATAANLVFYFENTKNSVFKQEKLQKKIGVSGSRTHVASVRGKSFLRAPRAAHKASACNRRH